MDCNAYLSDINQFVQKVNLIQKMFLEIYELDIQRTSRQNPEDMLINQDSAIDYSYEKNVNNIRNRFGLKVLEDKNQEILESLFQESNIISGALEIKIENNLDLRIGDDSNLSSKVFDDNDETEDEEEMLEEELYIESEISTIEELSESKLSLKYDQVESEEEILSESEQQLLKTKKRRKYRKSDEEQLFE